MTKVLEFIQSVNANIMQRYPEAFFCEADFMMKRNDDVQTYGPEVDLDKTVLGYGLPDGTSLSITFNADGRLFVEEVDGPWLECRPMSVYVPADLDEAYERLSSANFVCNWPPVCLRHQLAPGFDEPQWIFGTPEDCHTVGVFSAAVK